MGTSKKKQAKKPGKTPRNEHGGAATKHNDAIHAEIVRLIGMGNYLSTVAAVVGISAETIRNWVTWGKEGKEPWVKLARDFERASGTAQTNHVAVIAKAASDGDWRASSWFLERRFPKRFAEQSKQKLEHTGGDGGPVEVQVIEWNGKKVRF